MNKVKITFWLTSCFTLWLINPCLSGDFSFDENIYAFVIRATARPGKLLFRLKTNSCPVGHPEYEITETATPFSINKQTGEVYLSHQLELPGPNKYLFHVRAFAKHKECKAHAEVQVYIIHVNEHRPIMSAAKYTCKVKENDRKVDVFPPIRATDKDEGPAGHIKDIQIREGNVPFGISLNHDGSASLYTTEDLDAETVSEYQFTVYAVDNGTRHRKSERSKVLCEVVDENEYVPVFKQQAYSVVIERQRVYEKLLQVEATDEDISPLMGRICRYDLSDNEIPFKIDSTGVLSLVRPLREEEASYFEFGVSATDCDGKKSREDAVVGIVVKDSEIETTAAPMTTAAATEAMTRSVCKPGLKRLTPSNLFYPSCTKSVLLLPAVKITHCEQGINHEFQIRVAMDTSHIGKGCDRGSRGTLATYKQCGMEDGIDLLPSTPIGHPWLEDLLRIESPQGDVDYKFDGKTAVRAPASFLPVKWYGVFTVSSWVKAHRRDGVQFILSWSNGMHSNYSYVGLYLAYNAREDLPQLGFILNKENGNCQLNRQWNSQVGDGKWHHVSLSVENCNVQLFVDGGPIEPFYSKVFTHSHQQHIQPKYVIGGRWLGTQQKYTDYFHGRLSGLVFRPKTVTTKEDIKCLLACRESLSLSAPKARGFDVSYAHQSSIIYISGRGTITAVEQMLQGIAYYNTRPYGTPGKRTVKISMQVDNTVMPEVDLSVKVLKESGPQISLGGKCDQSWNGSPSELRGVKVCSDIEIAIDGCVNTLDLAVIAMEPDMADGESIYIPTVVLKRYGLTGVSRGSNFIVHGIAHYLDYMKALKQLIFVSKDKKKGRNVVLKIIVSNDNGRFMSNELAVEVKYTSHTTVTHRTKEHLIMVSALNEDHLPGAVTLTQKEGLKKSKTMSGSTTSMSLMVLSAIFSVSMVTIVVGFAVVRFRRNRSTPEDADNRVDLVWDDEGLAPVNITINPLVRLSYRDGSLSDNTLDAETSGASSDSDEDESEIDHEVRDRLEWDDNFDDLNQHGSFENLDTLEDHYKDDGVDNNQNKPSY